MFFTINFNKHQADTHPFFTQKNGPPQTLRQMDPIKVLNGDSSISITSDSNKLATNSPFIKSGFSFENHSLTNQSTDKQISLNQKLSLKNKQTTNVITLLQQNQVCTYLCGLYNLTHPLAATLPRLSNSSFDSSENQRNNNNHHYLCQLMQLQFAHAEKINELHCCCC